MQTISVPSALLLIFLIFTAGFPIDPLHGRVLLRRSRFRVRLAVPVLALLLVGCGAIREAEEAPRETEEAPTPTPSVPVETASPDSPQIWEYRNVELKDGGRPIEIITNLGFSEYSYAFKNGYRYIFDAADLHLMLEDYPATPEDCMEALRKNKNIDAPFRPIVEDFIHRFAERYPDADLTILCHNLKTLGVKEVSRETYLEKSRSPDSYGCYVHDENCVYLPVGNTYEEDKRDFSFQVLLHELCHAARESCERRGSIKYTLSFLTDRNNSMLQESMNSLFSCSLLNYEERDMTYQVPSNYLLIMLECMDNYELSDYINHSDKYFLRRLDEYTGHTNYAQQIWDLISLQREDWKKEDVDYSSETYLPIYKFLCDMYYPLHITEDMTKEERNAVAAELTEKAFYDAPTDYKIDTVFFYVYANEY